jgi:NAD(P)-dependent dehydrogenase (short-subunit alcohol dehydrogenase family)
MEKNKYGRIVNVSSGAGSLHFMTSGGTPAYSISKVAINALTRILAAEAPLVLRNNIFEVITTAS